MSLSLAQKHGEIICRINSIDGDLNELIIIKDEKLRKKILSKLQTVLINSFDESRTLALNKAIDYLLSIDGDKFKKDDAKKIDDILRQYLSKNLSTLVDDTINDLSEKLYKSGITDVSRSLKTKLSFDVIDNEAAGILADQTMFWIQSYYSDLLNQEISKIISEYFNSAKTIGEIASDFAGKFVDTTDKGFSYFEGLAEFTTYRTSVLGNVTGFEKAGVKFYQIKATLDERTSEICRNMDGRIFEVSRAIEFRDTILSLRTKEQIKEFAPWRPASDVEGKDSSELPLGMVLPPYHFRCRTIVIGYFGDTKDEPKTVPEQERSLNYENKELGLNVKLLSFEAAMIERFKTKIRPLTSRARGLLGRFMLYSNGDNAIELKKKLKEPKFTFFHELGHAVDFLLFNVDRQFDRILTRELSDQIFKIVFNRMRRVETLAHYSDEEIESLLKGWTVRGNLRFTRKYLQYVFSRKELFAETYGQYRNTPGKLKEYAIDFYNYFKKLIKELENNNE